MTIWDKHPNYTDDELRILTAAAAETLVDAANDSSITSEVLQLSAKSAARELKPLIEQTAPGVDQEQIQTALEDPEQSRKMALAVLEQIRILPELADQVSDAYEMRRREMAGPELLLLAGAVVILAIKLKAVRISPHGVEVDFDKAGKAVEMAVSAIFKGGIGG